jgi:hypothetical protein
MREIPRRQDHSGELGNREISHDCSHDTLAKVEESGINEVDTDVLIYACSRCGKTFTVTDY